MNASSPKTATRRASSTNATAAVLSLDEWKRLRELFDLAVQHPPGLQRQAALQGAVDRVPGSWCSAAMQSELDSLLQHHDMAEGAMTDLLSSGAAARERVGGQRAEIRNHADRSGQRLGAWVLVRRIGSGGMGEVYEARRADGQYEGRAAIKLVRAGLVHEAWQARFAHERQTLARLNHPHIARLLDAGTDVDGLSYFVMEHVQGLTLTEASRDLGLHERLALFVQLAAAVAHAHGSLLVHRDLKPANVLVDGARQVKLLDFGIAKALAPVEAVGDGAGAAVAAAAPQVPPPPTTSETMAGVRPLTPQYASPEQLRGEPITTATDIYSLGVILFELLVDARPTPKAQRTEPTAPGSARTAEGADLASATAGPHAVPSAQLKRWIGDLEPIVARALAPEPSDRYPTVEALAADVRALLQGRPISLRASSPAYVAERFVQRNAWAVLAAGLGLLGLAAGVIAATLQGRAALVLGVLALAAGLVVAMVQAQRAKAAHSRAERHVHDLRRMAREVIVQYGDAINHLPGGNRSKAQMLERIAPVLDNLGEFSVAPTGLARRRSDRTDTALTLERAAVHARLAQLKSLREYNAAPDLQRAVHHAAKADLLFEMADKAGPPVAQNAAAAVEWAQALSVLSEHAQQGGAPGPGPAAQAGLDRALACMQRAKVLLDRTSEHAPRNLAVLRERAINANYRFDLHFGWGRRHRNEPELALAACDEAASLHRAAMELPESGAEDWHGLGTVCGRRALTFVRMERWSEALEAARQAMGHQRTAMLQMPQHLHYQGAWAGECNLVVGLYLDSSRSAANAEEALRVSEQAWPVAEGMFQQDPEHPSWKRHRGSLALHHGRALLACGREAEAADVLKVSQDWLEHLISMGDAGAARQRRLALTEIHLALCNTQGQALRLAERAVHRLQVLLGAQPVERETLLAFAEVRCLQARLLPAAAAREALADARSAYARAQSERALTGAHAERARELWASEAPDMGQQGSPLDAKASSAHPKP